MWLNNGHSLGRKAQAISRALTCQYSCSSSFSFLLSAFMKPERDWIMKRSSVETQKYETTRSWSFSRKLSLDNWCSFRWNCKKSRILHGWICIMFPMFKLRIHSFWLRNPRIVLISTWSSFLSDFFASAGSFSSESSCKLSLSSWMSLSFFYYCFDLICSINVDFCSLRFLVSTEPSMPAGFVWNAWIPLFLLVPASLLPSSFIIGRSLRAVLSIIEMDSSRILNGMSLTGEFSRMNYF